MQSMFCCFYLKWLAAKIGVTSFYSTTRSNAVKRVALARASCQRDNNTPHNARGGTKMDRLLCCCLSTTMKLSKSWIHSTIHTSTTMKMTFSYHRFIILVVVAVLAASSVAAATSPDPSTTTCPTPTTVSVSEQQSLSGHCSTDDCILGSTDSEVNDHMNIEADDFDEDEDYNDRISRFRPIVVANRLTTQDTASARKHGSRPAFTKRR